MIIYTDDRLDTETGEALFHRLITAFPKMTHTTATMIIERMGENRFSRNRSIDAVNHVIDTYEGWDKIPNIANFIQYDRRVKILTYAEITKQTADGSISWDDYTAVDVGLDKPRWAKTDDVNRHALKKCEQ